MTSLQVMWLGLAAAAGLLMELAVVGGLVWLVARKMVIKQLLNLLQTRYSENLLEAVVGIRHFGLHRTLENELRASSGRPLVKPLGTHRAFPHFDGLLFSPAQLHRGALDDAVPVNLRTVIGRSCKRPLRLSMPILISGMGYGVGVSKPFSLALAKGADRVGTAFNTGQGPVLPEHRQYASRLVIQYHGASWCADAAVLAQADMIEIRYGQGANAGVASKITTDTLPPSVLADLGLLDQTNASIPAGIPGVQSAQDLKRLIEQLRSISRGVPIGIKLAAGHALERDMEVAIRAGADVLVLDGAQGGTHGSYEILVDDFGLPTLAALQRANQYLTAAKLLDHVSLIISGGIRTPGDMLKAIALGADAVYLGSAALFAATHTQLLKPLPFHPPTQVAWADGHYANQFDEEAGAASLANFLTSCAEEMRTGMRALGKRDIRDVGRDDLRAWDPAVARVTGLDLV